MTNCALFRQKSGLAKMHSRNAVRQLLKTNDDVGLDAGTIDEAWALWTTKAGIESWWGPDGFDVACSKDSRND